MRILVVGRVDARQGSVAGANHKILERLLGFGHSVAVLTPNDGTRVEDRFAFASHPCFTSVPYEPVAVAPALRARLPPQLSLAVLRLKEDTQQRLRLRAAARRFGGRSATDVVFFMGIPPLFRLPGLPTACHLQSLPDIEWRGIRDNRSQLSGAARASLMQLWRLYYLYRGTVDANELRLADGILVHNEWLRDELSARYPAVPVRIVRYPFDLRRFAAVHRASRRGRPRVLWLGRVVPRKRLDLYLGALRRMRDEGEPVDATLIGDCSLFPGLRTAIEEAARDGLVDYRPRVPHAEVQDLMASTDVLVQPSEWETMGSSVIEALAAGTHAVIGPTNGTLPPGHPAATWFERYEVDDVVNAIRRALARGTPATLPDGSAVASALPELYSADSVAHAAEAALAEVVETVNASA